MDKKLNLSEEQLFELIESRDFSELTFFEKEFVLQLISENEFVARRNVIKNVISAFDDEIQVEPQPLQLPQQVTSSLLTKSIPLYQVFFIAAMIVLLFLIVPLNQKEDVPQNSELIVQRDTIVVERLVHDTVISFMEKIVPVEKIVFVNSESVINYPKPQPRLFELSPDFSVPALNNQEILNKGNSLNGESTATILNVLPVINL